MGPDPLVGWEEGEGTPPHCFPLNAFGVSIWASPLSKNSGYATAYVLPLFNPEDALALIQYQHSVDTRFSSSRPSERLLMSSTRGIPTDVRSVFVTSGTVIWLGKKLAVWHRMCCLQVGKTTERQSQHMNFQHFSFLANNFLNDSIVLFEVELKVH